MRKKIVAANWKMNLTRSEALSLIQDIINVDLSDKNKNIIIAPPFPYLYKIKKLCRAFNNIFISAQNIHKEEKGAFTGCVSAKMLASCNVDYVILGHSEVREYIGDTYEDLKLKVDQALSNNIKIIFCCGENINNRENNTHFDLIQKQLEDSLFHLSELEIKNVMIAYEPIWAIGTGIAATTEQAQEMHGFIRGLVQIKYGDKISDSIPILYGVSCNPQNAHNFFCCKDIDGGLIGGASLDPDKFISIINAF